MEKARRLLESVGIETFVKYFDIIEASKDFRSNHEIIEAFKTNNENWSDTSMSIKASCGKAIFTKELVCDALTYICTKAKRIDVVLRKKAIELLDKYTTANFELSEPDGTFVIHSFKSTNVNTLAREMMYWILDQEEFASKINLSKVKTRNTSENEVASYKWDNIGKGTFIKAFNEEPTTEELHSGNSIRFFTDKINAEFLSDYNENLHYYLTNQWSKNDTCYSLSKLIEFINNQTKGRYEIKYSNQTLQVFGLNPEDQPQEENQDKAERINAVIDNINNAQYSKNSPKQKIIDYDVLVKRFVARLNTQNREYTSGIYFYPTLFIGIKELNYTEYIHNQIEQIHVYVNNERKKLNEFRAFRFKNGKLFGINNENKRTSKNLTELFFSLNNGKTIHSFENLFTEESDLSLGHLSSMHYILHHQCNKDIPLLMNISKEMKRLNLDYKTKAGLNEIRNYINTYIDLPNLKKELNLIHQKTEIDLIPRCINSAVGRY